MTFLLAQRKAEKLWRAGHRAWLEGQPQEAQSRWQQALDKDPTMADAMLGLYSLDDTQIDLLQSMLIHLDRFGKTREKFHLPLYGYYYPAAFMLERLETADDLRRAWALILGQRG